MPLSPLCAIVDVEAAARARWPPIDLARAFLDGGARFLQVRAKTLPSGTLLELAAAITDEAHSAGAMVIVNDRADIARLAGADGVHVGQDDLSPRAVRAIAGNAAILGVSTHTVQQLERALEAPVSYVAMGPVFVTATKATGYDAIGLETVRIAAGLASRRDTPLVAIGGITLETARSVIDSGAAAVAVIGDLLAGGPPDARVRAYLERLSCI
jgi:thiamine-phosphate pyrophosphorylase